jgi:transcriptional regulator with XRE-family HTH domain
MSREPKLPGRIVAGAQIRAARALLGWRRKDLSAAAKLHPNAVGYWEKRRAIPAGAFREPHACKRMREALERAGVQFVTDPGRGVAAAVALCARDNIPTP